MKKIVLLGIIFLLLFVIPVGCKFSPSASEPAPASEIGLSKGNLAPDFSLYDVEGKGIKLSDFQGKVVMLNFWATWCGPCKAEVPSMEALYQDYKDKGFVILAVNVGDSKNKVEKFVAENSLTFPILLDWSKNVSRQFQVNGLPTTFIIDKNGIITEVVIGTRNWEEDCNSKLISDLLEK